jgi:hypothetical protein
MLLEIEVRSRELYLFYRTRRRFIRVVAAKSMRSRQNLGYSGRQAPPGAAPQPGHETSNTLAAVSTHTSRSSRSPMLTMWNGVGDDVKLRHRSAQ